MNIEFELTAAETMAANGKKALEAGNAAFAKNCYKIAAEKYRKLAEYLPARKREFISLAEQCENYKLPEAKKVVAQEGLKPRTQTTGELPKSATPSEDGGAAKPTLEEALEELNQLVGLDEVKSRVRAWVKQYQAFELRKSRGLPTPETSHHMVFAGNPGTGKTTVARLMGKIFYCLGILSEGQLVEVQRGDLVGEYVGHTAIKTQQAIDRAQGGVLFIDEVYSLVQGGKNDFGMEAINTLMVAMENKRADFAVIVAGYEQPVKEFLSANRGLCSRFKIDDTEIGLGNAKQSCEKRVLSPNYIVFEDYDGEQMYQIFSGLCKKNGYVLDEDAAKELKTYLNNLYLHRGTNFANGRTVRNLFDSIVVNQSVRISSLKNPTDEQLMAITLADLPFNG
jgi:SpoVK/Ycf46/Vps4 family AAA+-type ATPase